MLRIGKDVKMNEESKTLGIGDNIDIYTRIMKSEVEGKTALFIHGGGSCSNHTMLVRPAGWLMEKKLFGKAILPDRRGEGRSSTLTGRLTIMDHAKDMKRLLDRLNIEGKISVLGISFGGPIALSLAGIDNRIDEVILIASSPSIKGANGLTALMNRCHLLEPMIRITYKRLVGKNHPEYPDLDPVYDIRTNKELNRLFIDIIKSTEKNRLESLILQSASTLDKRNNGVETSVKTGVPIYQVIGDKDAVWESALENYTERFPNVITTKIPGARHKDCFFRAEEFYEALLSIYPRQDKLPVD